MQTHLLFDNIHSKLELIGNTSIVVAGDWNVPLNYTMDTCNYLHKNNIKSNEAIKKISFDLVDVWREQHMQEKKIYMGWSL